MSSANSTIYYSAVEDMFKDMALENNENNKEQMDTAENFMPLVDTPKRSVRIRRLNLFGKDKSEFAICRRLLLSSSIEELSQSSQEQHREQQGKELLRLRRERHEEEQQPTVRRLTMRL
ncbi:hypothetical protein KR093_008566 [Drosophila rubida]|uniref:Uncharacterized protein n=1 Tax=Drosophila rubida TaxID=30044 RepID=A0AAD4PM02_9MUSC|nr:hypothetical protein KR093_008566 [Drosophila rubida]